MKGHSRGHGCASGMGAVRSARCRVGGLLQDARRTSYTRFSLDGQPSGEEPARRRSAGDSAIATGGAALRAVAHFERPAVARSLVATAEAATTIMCSAGIAPAAGMGHRKDAGSVQPPHCRAHRLALLQPGGS